MNVKPFVKWAGGKSQLLHEIRKKYPEIIEKYCEPFVGGGAVLWDILVNKKPNEVLINDINADLINAYIQIQNNINELIEKLSIYEDIYLKATETERREIYYSNRILYNNISANENKVLKAVLFIFLNKTCFNGLYRVNGKGEFNVPQGKYKNPLICDKENLMNLNKILQGVLIQQGDYKDCEYFIDNKTFVYIDPPYRPLPNTPSFTAYDKSDFTDKEQKELGVFIDKIYNKGAKVVLSNSDPKETDENDNFFDVLYSKYIINRIKATRMINSNGNKRGSVSELLITSY